MTKNEKLAIAEHIRSIASGMTYNGSKSEGLAKHLLYEWAMVLTVDAYAMAPSIAQSIRDAAVNWPQYLSGVECQIIDAFQGVEGHWWQALLRSKEKACRTQARTFMLLVAEALE